MEYSDDYKHMDGIVWKVPQWALIIFTGTVALAKSLAELIAAIDGISFAQAQGFVYLLGVAYQVAMAYMLYRARDHLYCISARDNPGFFNQDRSTLNSFAISRIWGGQDSLQALIIVQAAILAWLYIIPTIHESHSMEVYTAILFLICVFAPFLIRWRLRDKYKTNPRNPKLCTFCGQLH